MAEEKIVETEVIEEETNEIDLADIKMTDVAKAKLGKKFGSAKDLLIKGIVTGVAVVTTAAVTNHVTKKQYAKSEPERLSEGRYSYVSEADVEVIGEPKATVSEPETVEEA